MENRDAIIKQKAEEIQQQLTQWALENKILQSGERVEFSLSVRAAPIVLQKIPKDFLSIPIRRLKFLGFSRLACNSCLRVCSKARNGEVYDYRSSNDEYTYKVEDLIKRSSINFLEIGGYGKVTLNEIRKKLSEFGLHPADD